MATTDSMRILIATDAWDPQVNGVVRTMKRVIAETEAMGHVWEIVHPGDGFVTMPLPTYPEIKMGLFGRPRISEIFHEFEPDAVHIATEGTLGMAARAGSYGRISLSFEQVYGHSNNATPRPARGAPAVVSLAQLRSLLGDPLLVRTPRVSLTPLRKFWLAWTVQALGRL